jgi:hypothetical protein
MSPQESALVIRNKRIVDYYVRDPTPEEKTGTLSSHTAFSAKPLTSGSPVRDGTRGTAGQKVDLADQPAGETRVEELQTRLQRARALSDPYLSLVRHETLTRHFVRI